MVSTLITIICRLSLIVSIAFLLAQYLFLARIKYKDYTIIAKLNNSRFMPGIIVISLTISRFFFSIEEAKYNLFVFLSTIILFSYNVLRFVLALHYSTTNNIVFIFYFFLILLGLINNLIRMFIRLGNCIDNVLKNNPELLLTTGEYFDHFLRTGRVLRKYVVYKVVSPNDPRYTKLTKFGIVAGICTLPVAGYAAYDNHLSRLAAQDSAAAAQDSAAAAQDSAAAAQDMANAAKKRADVKATKAGLLSKDFYYNRYPEDRP